MPSEADRFLPSRALPTGHLQTVAGVFLPHRQSLSETRRHVLDTTGGDQLVIHENRPVGHRPDRHVLLLHGVGGSHASPYLMRTAHCLLESGFHVWRLDHRGCGDGSGLARQHHHAGRVEDLTAAVRWMRGPGGCIGPLTLIGFSLSGNLLLKWLAGSAKAQSMGVDSSIAIAPPVDLLRCVTELGRGLGRWYDLFFGKSLREQVFQRRRVRPDMLDRPMNPMPRRLYEFDEEFTAPLGGFTDAEQYYRKCSSMDDLHRIEISTMIVVDDSDPVVPVSMFADCEFSSRTRLVVTSGGGHIGYIARRGGDPNRFWIGWRICDWIRQMNDRESPKRSLELAVGKH